MAWKTFCGWFLVWPALTKVSEVLPSHFRIFVNLVESKTQKKTQLHNNKHFSWVLKTKATGLANICFIKNRTKHMIIKLLSLVPIFMKQTLVQNEYILYKEWGFHSSSKSEPLPFWFTKWPSWSDFGPFFISTFQNQWSIFAVVGFPQQH